MSPSACINPLAFAIAALSVVLFATQASASRKVCFNPVGRTVGDTNFYRWLCQCRENNIVTVRGTATVTAPTGKGDTLARFHRFIKCHDNVRRRFRLSHLCRNNVHEWQRVTKHEIRRCSHVPPTASDKKRYKGSFVRGFDRRFCSTNFLDWTEDGRSFGAWVCRCPQRRVRVHAPEIPPLVSFGFALIDTAGAPGGKSRELRMIRRCINGVKKQGNQVCSGASSNFSILARHLLEACCKRARALFPKKKFECKAIVPDDLSGLKSVL